MSIQKFAERITAKATEIADNVSEYIDNKRAIYELNADLANARAQLELLFAELGRLAYHGSSALADVRTQEEIVADINMVAEYINDTEEALAEYNKNKLDSEPLAEPIDKAPTEEPAQLYCHKCGKPQASDSDFCNKCGTKLVK